jgi:hypothetical protein
MASRTLQFKGNAYPFCPAHIHVKRDRQIVKFWLNPVRLETNRGFKDHELNQIAKIIEDNQETILEAWHDYFDP